MQDNIYILPVREPIEPEHPSLYHFPIQLTPLIGRKQDVASACGLLRRSEVRLLTLTGAGGVGKTRMALQVATVLVEDFADGISFIPLAPISDSDLVIPTIAQALGIKEGASRSFLDLLKAFLRDKHLLLLLDNFEQVLPAAPQLTDLLAVCSDLKLLVTSRAVLHVQSEHEFPVPPLALPDITHLPEPEILSHYAAIALFLQRAQAVKPTFQLNAANARLITEICVHLDGLPLAIELAAVRIKLLPPQALLARLGHRLEVLTSGAQDVPARQRTLRNTIAWSHQLLDAKEQRLFRWLSIFVSGCSLQAIEAVVVALDKGNGTEWVLDGVASLIDKSLLQQTGQEEEEPRLEQLETIREYGLEMLTASGELEPTRHAHATYFVRLVEQAAPKLAGSEQSIWLERLDQEYENLRAAMQWCLEQGEHGTTQELALRLGRALWQFWIVRGLYSEGRTFMKQTLAESDDVAVPVRAKALAVAADLASWQGDDVEVEVLAQQSLALYREFEDKGGMGHALWLLAAVAWRKRSDFGAACVLFEESLALQRQVGNQVMTAWVLLLLADTISMQGEYGRGQVLYEESLALFRILGNKQGIARSLRQSAVWIFACQGDQQTVRAKLEASLALSKELGDKGEIASCLWFAGWVALHWDDVALAQKLLEESVNLFKEIGDRWYLSFSLTFLGKVEVRQGYLTVAQTHFEESLKLARAEGHQFNIALGFEGLAELAAAQGRLVRAAQLWGTAESLRESMGIPSLPVHAPVERAHYEQMVISTRKQLGEYAFTTAWAEGRDMQNTMSAPSQVSTESPMAAPQKNLVNLPAGLTAREVEVLRLIAQGWTDAQIAQHLVISPRTVNRHTTSLYSKIRVSSRSAATRFAIEHQLL